MVSLKHAFTSGKAASADATLVDGPKWDAEHDLTLTALSVLGRSGATGGAAEEITAVSDGHVLFRSGTLVAFGQLPASLVSFTPTEPIGSIEATTVQGAIEELDSEKQPLDADLTAIAALTRTQGDLIRGGASAWERLALGTSGYHLQSDGTDAGWAGFLQAGTGAQTRTWQDKTRERVSPEDFGAVGNGTTDDSTAWTNAINYLDSLGGGAIHASPGATYIVQGLPIAECVYIHLNGAILRLPVTPTSAMFIAPAGFADGGDNTGFQGGGILNGELDGRDSTQRGIDFSLNNMGRLERFILDDVYIHDFSRAYSGSLNDRQPSIVNCRIHDNTEGVRIRVNHPYIRNTAFRTNGVAITCDTGAIIQDLHVTGCIFAFNDVHIAPGAGGEVQGCLFNGCVFYKAADPVGVTVNADNFFVGCEFVGVNDGDIGLHIGGRGCSVVGCNFGLSFNENASDCFGTAAIRLGADADDVCITGNVFWVLGTGPGIIDNGGTFRCLNVSGNTARIAGARKFISSTMSGANVLAHPNINSNSIEIIGTGLGAGEGVIQIADLDDVGASITGNVFFASGGTVATGHALALPDVTDSVITGNKFRNFDDPISVSGGSGKARWDNNLASPTASGLSALERGQDWRVLAASGVAIAHTGTTIDTTLVTIPLPAGTMGANGVLRVTTVWTFTNNGNNKILAVRLGGAAGLLVQNSTVTTEQVLRYQSQTHNRNSQASQVVSRHTATNGGFGTTTNLTTGTIDTSVDETIVIRAQLANGADTAQLESYTVEVLHQD